VIRGHEHSIDHSSKLADGVTAATVCSLAETTGEALSAGDALVELEIEGRAGTPGGIATGRWRGSSLSRGRR